jgi:hypothetical protein
LLRGISIYEYGFRRAIIEVITGFIISIIINVLINSRLISLQYKVLFDLINAVATFSSIQIMPYWGTGYLLGWLTGITIIAQFRILDLWEYTIYTIIGIIILVRRLFKILY